MESDIVICIQFIYQRQSQSDIKPQRICESNSHKAGVLGRPRLGVLHGVQAKARPRIQPSASSSKKTQLCLLWLQHFEVLPCPSWRGRDVNGLSLSHPSLCGSGRHSSRLQGIYFGCVHNWRIAVSDALGCLDPGSLERGPDRVEGSLVLFQARAGWCDVVAVTPSQTNMKKQNATRAAKQGGREGERDCVCESGVKVRERNCLLPNVCVGTVPTDFASGGKNPPAWEQGSTEAR